MRLMTPVIATDVRGRGWRRPGSNLAKTGVLGAEDPGRCRSRPPSTSATALDLALRFELMEPAVRRALHDTGRFRRFRHRVAALVPLLEDPELSLSLGERRSLALAC